MLIVNNLHKSIGAKVLLDNADLKLSQGNVYALIGRNGMGKTTLFRILTQQDHDYSGEIILPKNTRMVATEQEHFFGKPITALEYILRDVPEYNSLQEIINLYEKTPLEDHLQAYSDAVTRFGELGYYEIENEILETLNSFGLDIEKALGEMQPLSGGEKRFVELTRIIYSNADLIFIDEPTNHMDYVGKEKFIHWLDEIKKEKNKLIIVITHDRDVLGHVDKIIELKDKNFIVYNGDYNSYLTQNSIKNISGINEYEIGLKRLEKLKKQIKEARVVKLKARDQAARIREERFQKEYNELKEHLKKPSFWIDQESKENLSEKITDSYEKYKEKNILLSRVNTKEHKRELLKVTNLSLGYNEPLFKNINFAVHHGDRIFIKGRNGAGKSTLVKTIVSEVTPFSIKVAQGDLTPNHPNHSLKKEGQIKIYQGEFKISGSIRLGVYEQEFSKKILNLTLKEAIIEIYYLHKLDINDQKARQVMSQYLFSPIEDENTLVENLSGGQKARLQLIKMLANNPNLLILDEPTNHLDLPSIEELENCLNDFDGAIIYISHDNYLVDKLGGEVIEIKK